MTYEPLHHKYRPKTFAELVGQEAIAQTLTNAILSERIAPAYLFTGPRGTGKTSSARILAKSLNCLAHSVPTETPCGKCDVCQGITKGTTLDVIEIDAASNTGVDNIRDLIERAQFAPVQCRYKVYVIDECLTGDSLVQTTEGLIPIGDRKIKDTKVLSYNEALALWEFKPVLRWLKQGEKPTLTIKTTKRKIQCTGNHLIRTQQGWIAAKNLKAGAKILSPINKNNTSSQTLFEQVKTVNTAGIKQVYDLEVEGNHNFVANGLLVHNCHMLSTAAFNSLLKTLEEPPDRVVFVLATTDPQRVLPTIISRCQKFDFRRIPLEAMAKHLHEIAQKENINIASDALQMVAQLAQGGLRDAESLLDQLSLSAGEVTVEKVWDLVGAVPENDLMALLEAIAGDNAEAVIEITRHLMDRGREPLIVLQNLASFYRDLLIAKTAPNRPDLVTLTPGTWKKLCQFAQNKEVELILAGQKHLQTSEAQIKNTTQPRLWLEFTLLGLLPSALKTYQPTGTTPPSPPQEQNPPTSASLSVPKTEEPRNISGSTSTHQSSESAENTVPETPSISAETEEKSPEISHSETVDDDSSVASPTTPSHQPFDLKVTWQQVLAHTQPMTTKQFFLQQGELLSFDGQIAVILLKAPKLIKMAKDRMVNLEAAFHKVFNAPVTVRLILANSPEIDTYLTNNLTASDRVANEIPPPPPSPSETESDGRRPAFGHRSPSLENTNQNDLEIKLPPKSLSISREPIETQTLFQREKEAMLRTDRQVVTQAAERLANLFSGEVIDFLEDTEVVNQRDDRNAEPDPTVKKVSPDLTFEKNVSSGDNDDYELDTTGDDPDLSPF